MGFSLVTDGQIDSGGLVIGFRMCPMDDTTQRITIDYRLIKNETRFYKTIQPFYVLSGKSLDIVFMHCTAVLLDCESFPATSKLTWRYDTNKNDTHLNFCTIKIAKVTENMSNRWKCNVAEGGRESITTRLYYFSLIVKDLKPPQTMLVNGLIATTHHHPHLINHYTATYDYHNGDNVHVLCVTTQACSVHLENDFSTLLEGRFGNLSSSIGGFRAKLRAKHHNTEVICRCMSPTRIVQISLKFRYKHTADAINVIINENEMLRGERLGHNSSITVINYGYFEGNNNMFYIKCLPADEKFFIVSNNGHYKYMFSETRMDSGFVVQMQTYFERLLVYHTRSKSELRAKASETVIIYFSELPKKSKPKPQKLYIDLPEENTIELYNNMYNSEASDKYNISRYK
ncbi:uncharacterized protein LOC142986747 [Anticarsia gemmatalis]|uniref:uncharacterized protein LOC142986747 n=1 Tax=Anticarsia gemmatalis TaxID=129554 RepID=UPI003F760F5A